MGGEAKEALRSWKALFISLVYFQTASPSFARQSYSTCASPPPNSLALITCKNQLDPKMHGMPWGLWGWTFLEWLLQPFLEKGERAILIIFFVLRTAAIYQYGRLSVLNR